MAKLISFSIAALFLGLSSVLASAQSGGETEHVSPADQAAIDLAERRGLLIYQHDQAAWHVTDTMREDISDPAKSGIRGWVVTKAEEGLLVTFWKPDGEGYAGVYSAVHVPGEVRDRRILEGEATALTPLQIELIQARLAVDVSEVERCTNANYNFVILEPDQSDDPILVYFLVPQLQLHVIPFGGHYRFTVREGKVVDQRKFTNSCLQVARTLEVDGGDPVSMFVTHLLDPVPTEIHVFSMYAARLPITVLTAHNDKIWTSSAPNGQPEISFVSTLDDVRKEE